jgi:ABC-2 type transport system ATP-binding protein
MKILTTYIVADEGTALVNGHDVTRIKSRTVSIGYLPEHNPLYLDLYVREYLAITLIYTKLPNLVLRKYYK